MSIFTTSNSFATRADTSMLRVDSLALGGSSSHSSYSSLSMSHAGSSSQTDYSPISSPVEECPVVIQPKAHFPTRRMPTRRSSTTKVDEPLVCDGYEGGCESDNKPKSRKTSTHRRRVTAPVSSLSSAEVPGKNKKAAIGLGLGLPTSHPSNQNRAASIHVLSPIQRSLFSIPEVNSPLPPRKASDGCRMPSNPFPALSPRMEEKQRVSLRKSSRENDPILQLKISSPKTGRSPLMAISPQLRTPMSSPASPRVVCPQAARLQPVILDGWISPIESLSALSPPPSLHLDGVPSCSLRPQRPNRKVSARLPVGSWIDVDSVVPDSDEPSSPIYSEQLPNESSLRAHALQSFKTQLAGLGLFTSDSKQLPTSPEAIETTSITSPPSIQTQNPYPVDNALVALQRSTIPFPLMPSTPNQTHHIANPSRARKTSVLRAPRTNNAFLFEAGVSTSDAAIRLLAHCANDL